MTFWTRWLRPACLVAVIWAAWFWPSFAEEKPVTVFAAASLKNVMDDVRESWLARSGQPMRISYGASSALARQIEQGAPADIFISADLDWMTYLAERKLVTSDSIRSLLGNRLVLVASSQSRQQTTIAPGFDLSGLLGDGRLVLCEPAVPVGKYGRAALQALGVWPAVEGRLALAPDVRSALLLVARGEAPAGIVYATDAAVELRVKVLGLFPQASHPPIVYPAALTAAASTPAAAQVLAFIGSTAMQPVFERYGFEFLPPPPLTN